MARLTGGGRGNGEVGGEGTLPEWNGDLGRGGMLITTRHSGSSDESPEDVPICTDEIQPETLVER